MRTVAGVAWPSAAGGRRLHEAALQELVNAHVLQSLARLLPLILTARVIARSALAGCGSRAGSRAARQ